MVGKYRAKREKVIFNINNKSKYIMKALLENKNVIVGQIKSVPKELEYISKLLDIIVENNTVVDTIFEDSYNFICDEYAKIIAKKFSRNIKEIVIIGFKKSDEKDTEIVEFCYFPSFL